MRSAAIPTCIGLAAVAMQIGGRIVMTAADDPRVAIGAAWGSGGWGWVVSILTTAGSTRLAISANEAESASGARAICMSGCATVGRPDNIAPIVGYLASEASDWVEAATRSA